MDEHRLYLHTGQTKYHMPNQHCHMVKTEMKQIVAILTTVAAGFIGGLLGARMTHSGDQYQLQRVVRARSFELVTEDGRVLSFWGLGKDKQPVLAFGGIGPDLAIGGDYPRDHNALDLRDPYNQHIAMGVDEDRPFLFFRGSDGKTRVRLYLSPYGKPFLLMEDETGPRVLLGVQQSDTPGPRDNDWVLDFGPDRARIGMFTSLEGEQRYLQGMLSINRDKIKYPFQQPK